MAEDSETRRNRQSVSEDGVRRNRQSVSEDGVRRNRQSVSEDGVRRNRRKVREGVVVSNRMDKTAIVEASERVRHPRYDKTVQRTTRLAVHDADNTLGVGDLVRVTETRPLSKTKRWRLVEIVERAK